MPTKNGGFRTRTVERFGGLVTTLDPQDLLPEQASRCQNAVFTSGGIDSREGTSTICNLGGGTDVFHGEFLLFNDTRYFFYLMEDHKLYYTTGAFGARTLLYSPSGSPTQFQLATYGNLIYIFFGGASGTYGSQQAVVWSPSGGWVDIITILPEAIGTMAAANGAAGDVTVGVHLLKVVFETRSGFRSKPTTGVLSYTAPGSLKISLTNLPLYTAVGGHAAAECTKRHIVMTEAGLETYYIALTISDNTTTTGTIDISDEELAQGTDVTNYFQYTSPMPSLSAGKIYHERLCACGDSSNATLDYISELGSPQTFRADTGFLDINHNDGVTLVQMFKIRDRFYFIKGLGIYSTQDNGSEPNSWPLTLISNEVGTASLSGISESSDEDFVVIQDFRGMYRFYGSPPDKVSKEIQPTWDTVSIGSMKTGEIHIDTVKRRIYNLVPTGVSTLPDSVFVCDYSDGWERTKWSIWKTAGLAWRSMQVDTGGYRVLIAQAGPLVQKIDDTVITDNGTAIEYFNRTGMFQDAQIDLALFGGIHAFLFGTGSMTLKAYSLDGTLLQTLTSFTLSAAPGQDLYRRMNIRNERIMIEFGHNATNASSAMHRMSVEMQPDGERAK